MLKYKKHRIKLPRKRKKEFLKYNSKKDYNIKRMILGLNYDKIPAPRNRCFYEHSFDGYFSVIIKKY